jgi:hypothetical protein
MRIAKNHVDAHRRDVNDSAICSQYGWLRGIVREQPDREPPHRIRRFLFA